MSLYQVTGIDRFVNGKFILKDNSSIIADVLLLCTGYEYNYSFLDDSSGVTVDDNFVSPLYQHIFNVKHPSMSFVGVSTGIIPFPMFHQQVVIYFSSQVHLLKVFQLLKNIFLLLVKLCN